MAYYGCNIKITMPFLHTKFTGITSKINLDTLRTDKGWVDTYTIDWNIHTIPTRLIPQSLSSYHRKEMTIKDLLDLNPPKII